jgi:hypothetical protein
MGVFKPSIINIDAIIQYVLGDGPIMSYSMLMGCAMTNFICSLK